VTYIFHVFHAAERRIDSAFADLVPQESLILIFAQFTAGKAQSAPENGTERLKVSQHPPLNTMNLMGRPCWILGPPQSAGCDRRFKPQYRCGELLRPGCSRSRRRSPRQWRHFDRYRDHAIVFRQEKYSRETGGPVARWNWPASPANVNVPVANVKLLLFGEPSVPSYTTPTYGTESKWESLPAPVGIPGSTQAAGEFQRRQGYALSYKKGEANPSWP